MYIVLCVNRYLRSQILPHTNLVAYQQIIQVAYERYILPGGPFDFNDEGKKLIGGMRSALEVVYLGKN